MNYLTNNMKNWLNSNCRQFSIRGYQGAKINNYQVFIKNNWTREVYFFTFRILWRTTWEDECQRVKFSRCLQRLKQIYLLTYYQKEWADRTKKILGIFFRRIIHLTLTACKIHTSISFVHIYVCSYACHSPLSVHPPIYVSLYRDCPCVCPYPLRDRCLPLSPNIALHVRPRISTKRPPPVIVGIIWSPQSFFITFIQYCTLNISVTHSSFGTHCPGPLVVVPFAT